MVKLNIMQKLRPFGTKGIHHLEMLKQLIVQIKFLEPKGKLVNIQTPYFWRCSNLSYEIIE